MKNRSRLTDFPRVTRFEALAETGSYKSAAKDDRF